MNDDKVADRKQKEEKFDRLLERASAIAIKNGLTEDILNELLASNNDSSEPIRTTNK
jgi:hypothetical protein